MKADAAHKGTASPKAGLAVSRGYQSKRLTWPRLQEQTLRRVILSSGVSVPNSRGERGSCAPIRLAAVTALWVA